MVKVTGSPGRVDGGCGEREDRRAGLTALLEAPPSIPSLWGGSAMVMAFGPCEPLPVRGGTPTAGV